MKKLFLSVFVWLSGLGIICAQNKVFYSVQIGTFLNATLEEFSALSSDGFIYANPIENNLYQVFIGQYENKKDAQKVADKLFSKGYTNAFAQEQFTGDGKEVVVIQIATRNLKKPLNWDAFVQTGDLYTQPAGKQVKILTGTFAGIEAAKQKLPEIQKLGFKDAFVKKINSAYLHKVGGFELGDYKQPLIPLNFENGRIVASSNQDIPRGYDQPQGNPASRDLRAATTPRTVVSTPKIRAKVKRGSVLELQKLLKAEDAYSGSLDGLYGANTNKAYHRLLLQNRMLKKYLLISQAMPEGNQGAANLPLQGVINNINANSTALLDLERYNAPISNAYRAYLLFYNYGPSVEVNQLMNSAIKGAYPDNKFGGLSPVDPSASYSYNDMNQVMLHLLFVHSADGSQYSVPCWLFSAHPNETARANTIMTNFPGFNYATQHCDQFSSWEAVKVLQAIAEDLNDQKQLNKNRLALDAAARNDLYLANQPLVASEQKALEDWHNSLWRGLSGWASRDPLHQNMLVALKSAYFQTMILLEDFYMNKGLKAEGAKGLALASLHTMVGYHLERFL